MKTSPIDYFDRSVVNYPRRQAIADNIRSYSYHELDIISHILAKRMRQDKRSGEMRWAVWSKNDPRVVMCLLAIMRVGGTWASVNLTKPLEMTIAYLRYIQVEGLVYESSLIPMLERIRTGVPTLSQCICLDDIDTNVATISIDSGQRDMHDYDTCDDVVAILETSGTTGAPKAMLFDIDNWVASVELDNYCFPKCDHSVWLAITPLVYRGWPAAFAMLARAATLVLVSRFDPALVIEAIETRGVTHAWMVPMALYELLEYRQRYPFKCSTLKMINVRAAPVSPNRLVEAVDVFGPCISQAYGQIETGRLTWLNSATLTNAVKGIYRERLASCGQPVYSAQMAVLGENGEVFESGQEGEIAVKTQRIKRTFGMPQTSQVSADQWHRTGDIGVIDKDQYVYISDRKKDMIITGGHNVYSSQVELVIMELPEVSECAVIGVPDELLGEAVRAIVVAKQGEISVNSIIAHCKKRIGRMDMPMSIELRPSIPRAPGGKVDKRALRLEYWATQARNVN